MKYTNKDEFEKVNVFGTGAPNDGDFYLSLAEEAGSKAPLRRGTLG